MIARAYGHIPDEEMHVLEDLVSARAWHPPAFAEVGDDIVHLDRSALVDEVEDQGGTSSCVSQALCTAVELSAKLKGHPIPRISRRAHYAMGRFVDRPGLPLLDTGMRPRSGLVAAQEHGFCADARWPWDEAAIDVAPPWDVHQHAVDALLTGYYRIASGGEVAESMRQAVRRGLFPTFAMPVDHAYEQYDGSAVVSALGAPVGNHAQAVVGFGEGWILVLNSWGRGWGQRGVARIADALINRVAFDVIVPTVAPKAVT